MVYKVSLENYFLKLRRLLLFSLVLLALVPVACTESKTKLDKVPVIITRKAIEFFKDGKPKLQELYSSQNGELVLFGFEELYPSGKIKITGKYTSDRKREGLWESFYEDGQAWSIGSFSKGVESGEKKVWYPNGKLRYKGEIKNDKPIGLWEFWDKKGKKTLKKY